MVRHVVLYWLKDNSPASMENTLNVLRSMTGKIEGMLSLEAGADDIHSPRSCDICLCETFDSFDSLERYRTHPIHLPVQEHMHQVVERSASADFEIK